MTRYSLTGLCAVLLLASGCLTGLTEAGAHVQVGKVPPVAGCRELGIVMGSGGGGAYTRTEAKVKSAMNELRNRTAAMGGDFVELDTSAGDIVGITISGRAFDCSSGPAPQVASPPSPGGTPASRPPIEERLRRLDELRQKNLITPEEYSKRREEILHET